MTIRASKPKLIVLDHDAATLQQVVQAAHAYYQVIPTRDPLWAAAWLGQYRDVSVFVASAELAGPNLALFYRAQAMRADVMRILITPQMQASRFSAALMQGTVHRLLRQPFDAETLLDMICLEDVGVEVSPHHIVAG